MFTKRLAVNASIAGLSLLIATPSFANLNTQFSQCAASALEAKNISVEKISIDLDSNSAFTFDHDQSTKTRELKMEIANPKSGEFLGKVSCRVNSEGIVESVQYLSQTS